MEYWKKKIDEFIEEIQYISDNELKLEVLCELEERAINAVYLTKEKETEIA